MSIGNSNSPEDDQPSTDDRSEDRLVPSDGGPSIGTALKKARIAAGLTVDEVSSTTRVRIPIVHAIEQDDFTRCGGDVYARGHVRTLARAVGLDPAPLVEAYDAAHGGRPAPTPAAPLFEAERIRPERQRPNWTAAMVAAIVAVVGFVGFTAFSGGDEGGKRPVAEGSAAPKPAPKQSGGQSPQQPQTPQAPQAPKPEPSDSAIAAAPKDMVTVVLTAADGESWISAKDHSGRTLFDGTLAMGDSKTFTDKESIDLVLGDAGAVQLFVNGKEIKDEFQSGQVERLTYTKEDPRQAPAQAG
ncbi:helix-turn-helix domain-containing protein [Streptomyces antimicrobicus]|uniref:Helix-turn-helix domain-containing protein n=1 Tax=Streptomyces antimicrobicus TaxID=2883108 RepID=A0ABS8BAM8_9ACTN|nr:RodZ domain-containing protein [Streptomyces antimicrobicus]MCB5181701.1 helix-turn-helix domain-containing protein [Streptomyces antimicrobicus]